MDQYRSRVRVGSPGSSGLLFSTVHVPLAGHTYLDPDMQRLLSTSSIRVVTKVERLRQTWACRHSLRCGLWPRVQSWSSVRCSALGDQAWTQHLYGKEPANIMLTRAKLTPIPQLMGTVGKRLGTQTRRLGASYTVRNGDQQQERTKPGTSDCSTSQQRLNTSVPTDKLIVNIQTFGLVQSGQAVWLMNVQGIEALSQNPIKRLSSGGRRLFNEFPGTLLLAGHVAMTTCHGDDFFVETSRTAVVSLLCSVAFSTDRLGLRYLVNNHMTEATQATDGMLAWARRGRWSGQKAFESLRSSRRQSAQRRREQLDSHAWS